MSDYINVSEIIDEKPNFRFKTIDKQTFENQ